DLDGANFRDGLRFSHVEGPTPVVIDYTLPHGKRRHAHNEGRAMAVVFQNAVGREMAIELRAFPDGAAFRYRLDAPRGETQRLEAEHTGWRLPEDARLWMHPADRPGTYSPAYETYYENEVPVGTACPTGCGWSFPVLFRTADGRHWGLITEANLGPEYFGGRLTADAPGGLYRIRFPEPAEGLGTGELQPTLTLPGHSPWRLVILGDRPGALVESTLVQDLSDPSRVPETDWIRPGRVAWSWWSDQPSPRDARKQIAFVDFAAEMGWEYVLVDANWTIMDHGNIHDVLRHAREKGVGVLLWYNSGGPHNRVTEKPRGTMADPDVRRFEFDLLRRWGVRGVKVDFFQSDKPNVIRLYHDILRDAADHRLMVNFHGCTLPRGWSRTWPHLMSMEAVRGEECYIFDPAFPERAPQQNVITPFTRNVVGPMDYTPAGLSDNRYPRLTTTAHELALPVVFESGWIHFADAPDAYRALPADVKAYLRTVPAAWDDTRCPDGYPGRYIVIARRSGERWYLAGLNGTTEPREIELPLKPFLPAAGAQGWLLADGAAPREIATSRRRFVPGDALKVRLAPRGGFVLRLEP
ncbi:MAG: glycoside hydrolase family 97 protein, partial [Verrucomicrobia bacterium]